MKPIAALILFVIAVAYWKMAEAALRSGSAGEATAFVFASVSCALGGMAVLFF